MAMAVTAEYADAAAAEAAAGGGEALMLVDIWRKVEEWVTLRGSSTEGGQDGGGNLVFVVINVMLKLIKRSNSD